MHSALASSALLAAVPDLAGRTGYGADGSLSVRRPPRGPRRSRWARSPRPSAPTAQRATRAHAGEVGIGAIHECGGPDIAGEDDFTALLALAAAEAGPEVYGYWGELRRRPCGRDSAPSARAATCSPTARSAPAPRACTPRTPTPRAAATATSTPTRSPRTWSTAPPTGCRAGSTPSATPRSAAVLDGFAKAPPRSASNGSGPRGTASSTPRWSTPPRSRAWSSTASSPASSRRSTRRGAATDRHVRPAARRRAGARR